MAIRSWLDWIKAKHSPPLSWADEQRNHALELIAKTTGSGAWTDLSRHANGFVREAAVRELSSSSSPEALVALIERLNDWVPQVREVAERGMQAYFKREHVTSLLLSLGPLLALGARRRGDHSTTLAKVRAVLEAPDVRGEVHASFLAQQSKAASYLFELLLEASEPPELLLREALLHREVNVRLAAVDACGALATSQVHALLHDVMPRSIARVRTRILRVLLPVLDHPQPLLHQSLLDGSAAVRNLALWEAPRYQVDATAILAARLSGQLPSNKADWLGVLGLARDLRTEVPHTWWKAAITCAYPSVQISALSLPGEKPISELIDALDDRSDKVFAALIRCLGNLSWATTSDDVKARLDRQWHELSGERRQQLLGLLAMWKQLAYLMEALSNEPDRQPYWLLEITRWCNRQYGMLDPFTPKAEQTALKDKLQRLATLGQLDQISVARVL